MPLFACSKCGCVENTALSEYWYQTAVEKVDPLCSACDPEIGEWHGKFDQRSAAGMLWGSGWRIVHPDEVSRRDGKKLKVVTSEGLSQVLKKAAEKRLAYGSEGEET